MLITKSAETVALSDLEQNKHLVSIPEFSLEGYQRPENNITHLCGKQTEDFDKALLSAMFFGKELIRKNLLYIKVSYHCMTFCKSSLNKYPLELRMN